MNLFDYFISRFVRRAGRAWLLLLTLAAPGVFTAQAETKPIRALLVIGGCCHDYEQQQKILTEGISARANVQWTIVHEGDGSTSHRMSVYENPDWSKGYDVVVHDECCSDVKDKDFVENILKPHRAGLPAVNLHCAMHCYRVDFDTFKDWFEFTGLDSRWHGAQLPIALDFVPKTHPITRGLTNWTTVPEELYNNHQVWPTTTPLIYGQQGTDRQMVAWVNDYHGTRVFSTTLGHNDETVGDPRYLDLVTRGLLWSVNKLNSRYLKPAKHVLLAAAPGQTVMEPENLALHKTASASASQTGREAAFAVDGLPDTRWCAPDNGSNYWWQVDLLKPQSLTGCRILWEKSAPYQYKIEGSADAQSWKVLAAENSEASRPQSDSHKFNAEGIRYVRITITRAPEGSWASFWEVEVWGKKMVEHLKHGATEGKLSGVKVPAGFQPTYYAGPLDVSYPTCVAATPTGEVFVGVDQNSSLDTATNRGWVVRCRDTHGTGVADQFNIFARMDSPRGIVFDHHTLYVMHPPVLEAFYDDKGVGTANRSEILVRGLGHDLKFRGADHTCNGVRLGIDGWLYIALGDYGAQHAVGRDGREIQVHGGGIVRVRPDGSGLEIVAQGTRNIYDVAIDPLMNLFTCDNTNDGDDWNVRLSHMIATANYGYPSLFRNFSDEMMPTMADYGGGAPTGAIFLDEPGFPNGLGYGLYACQWGWNSVMRHPLQPDGATFKVTKEPFIEAPRPTGIDADGEGNLYVASWQNAGFTYAGPNEGFVLRAHSMDAKLPPFPNLPKSRDAQLLKYLASPSAVWRLHVQQEILRRGPKPVFTRGLEKIIAANTNLAVRVAAIFTLEQLDGTNAQPALLKSAANPELREYALHALADQKKFAENLPTQWFTGFLKDTNPAVRLQALIALNRLHRVEAAADILPFTADADPAISHIAFRALVALDASQACFAAIDRGDAALLPGALRVLRNLHEPAVADGLIARLGQTTGAAHDGILTALCRLYYREADYNGSWWGTRPDTSGPYFKWVTWEASGKIGETLLTAVAHADEPALRRLLAQFKLDKIDFPGLAPALMQAAKAQPELKPAVIDALTGQIKADNGTIPFLLTEATDATLPKETRVQAFEALEQARPPEALYAAFQVLCSPYPKDEYTYLKLKRLTFIHEPRLGRQVADFVKLAETGAIDQKQLAYAALIGIATSTNVSPAARQTADQAIRSATNAYNLKARARAISETKSSAYRDLVPVKVAYEIGGLPVEEPLEKTDQKMADPKNFISNLAYPEVVRTVLQTPGDPAAGAQLFESLSCVKCHTISKDQPLKGPYLGDITARYSRPEIIESILKPSAQIAQGFVTTTVETKDGSEYDGFIVRESGDQLELRNLAGVSVIPFKDIVKRGTRPTSIMPEGLLDQRTPADLASLLAYLQSLQPKS